MFPCKVISVRKNEKNVFFIDFYQKTLKIDEKHVFFGFSDAYNFTREHRRELRNPSFCSAFFALPDGYI